MRLGIDTLYLFDAGWGSYVYVIITVGNEHGGLHNVWHYAAASGMLQMCPISLVGSVVSGYHQEATPSGTAHSLKARLWIASNTVNPLRDCVLTAGLCADTLYSREDCIVVNYCNVGYF